MKKIDKMFDFLKKKTSLTTVNTFLIVDIHSHLIPYIDDGAKSMDESILLLQELKALGYKKCITTPHIMLDAYGNTKESILKDIKHVQHEIISRGIEIELEAAAEYYLDEGLLNLIQDRDLLLIGSKYLLFETSYHHRPLLLEKVIFEILTAGYIPLLAHPERYRYMNNNLKDFLSLRDLGVEFQINLNSFNGYYGKNAQKQALLLSKHGLIDFLGSDTHHIKHIDNLKNILNQKTYQDIFKHCTIKNNRLDSI